MIKLKTLLCLVILCVCVFSNSSCSRKNHNTRLVQNYYNQLNQSNYLELSKLIGDSIIIIDGEYDMRFSKSGYYKFFQWDSVFSPTYEILDIREVDKKIEVKISKTCTRIQFLNQKPLISKEIIEIEDQKISKINFIKHYSDFKHWGIRKNNIIAWIKNNHPELDGFMYDQTKTGAENYLKAMALYNKSENY